MAHFSSAINGVTLSVTNDTRTIVTRTTGGNFPGGSCVRIKEIFLGGEGDDTVTMGEGDLFDMGAGVDALHFFGTTGKDNIHIDAETIGGHVTAFFHGTVGDQRAVFENGEVVTIFTESGNDKVKVHNNAADLWNVEVVE